MTNLDELLQGVTLELDAQEKWGFKATDATEDQTALIATYKISILTHLQGLPLETHATKCPFCNETPFWYGASRYQGDMTIVCPRCGDKSTLPDAALNTFFRLYGPDEEFYRPTLQDYNQKFIGTV
jgi:endogenous inhibitor of DNA gyrase (YacG/DUF329 family)